MKKKLFSVLLCVCMVVTMFAGCGGDDSQAGSGNAAGTEATGGETTGGEVTGGDVASGKEVIRVMSFTDEVPNMIQKYLDTHPEFPYTIETVIVATTDGLYQPALDQALAAGGDEAPDIYCAEAAFILKYAQGDASGYAAAYEDLGIDVDAAVKAADIAQYTIDIGTNKDGKLVGLGYQATGGAFIYRRSVAQATWGTDDPAVVAEKIGAGSGSWDKFYEAAEELKKAGFGIISGDGDL